MQAFHLLGLAPFYTNSFLLISEAGHAVVIDPAAEVQEYDHAKLYCEAVDCQGVQLFPLHPEDVDSGYEEGGTLSVDELKFTVWHTPGHTKGGVVLLCGDELLFAGDTVFQGSIGRTDLAGGDMAEMEKSLCKIARLPISPKAQLLPGHGDFSTLGEELENNFYIQHALRNAKAE